MWDDRQRWAILIAMSVAVHILLIVPLIAGRDEPDGAGMGAGRSLAPVAATTTDETSLPVPVVHDPALRLIAGRDVPETGAIDGSPVELPNVVAGQSADPVPASTRIESPSDPQAEDDTPAMPPVRSGMGAGRGATLPSFDVLPIPAPPPKPRAVAVKRAHPPRPTPPPARDLDAAYVPPPAELAPPPPQSWLRRGLEAGRSHSGPTGSADSVHGEASPAASAGAASSGGGGGAGSAAGAGSGAAGVSSAVSSAASAAAAAASGAASAAAGAASGAAGAAAGAASGAAGAAAGAASGAAGAAAGAAGAAAGAASGAAGAAAAAAGAR
jgi:hypothetical protein